MSNEERVRDGKDAAALVANPLFIDAFEAMEREIFQEIRKCPLRDAEGLGKLHLMLGLTSRLQKHFEALIQTGKLAEATLQQRLAGRRRLIE